jgi:hypothetical protein
MGVHQWPVSQAGCLKSLCSEEVAGQSVGLQRRRGRRRCCRATGFPRLFGHDPTTRARLAKRNHQRFREEYLEVKAVLGYRSA